MSLPVYVPPPPQSLRERFAEWRRTRPFWGGLWAIVAGVYLWSLTAAPIGVVVIQGVAGISSIVICLVMVLVSVAVWAQPQLRVIGGGIVIVLGLAAILLSNLGGFLVGTLMALHGGASMVAWKPFVQRWRRPDAAPASAGAVTALVDRMSDGQDGADATDGPADDRTDDVTPVTDDATDDAAPDTQAAAPRDPHEVAPPPTDVPASDPGPARPAGGMSAGMTILPSAPPAGPAPSPADGSGPQASASYSSVIR